MIAHSLAISEACEEAARSVVYRRTAEKQAHDFALSIASDLFALDTERELDIVSSTFQKIKQHIEQVPKTAATRTLRAVATELLTRCRMNDESALDKVDEGSLWSMPKTPSAFQTPRAKALRFGWDDDLCEWVAKTPFTREMASDRPSSVLRDKENQEPETPDVLTRTIVKPRCTGERQVGLEAQQQGPQRCTLVSKSPQVVIVRAAKRRKSDRIKAKATEEESEDELAV